MRKFAIVFAVLVALCGPGAPVQAGGGDENPCGNHGNHCCTDDGGSSFVSTIAECESFCSSTAQACAVAVSECSAQCAQTCVNECKVPICLDQRTKVRTINGVTYKTTRCKVVG